LKIYTSFIMFIFGKGHTPKLIVLSITSFV